MKRASGAPHPALQRYLASLCDAVLARDQRAVGTLLGRPVATHLPRDVREEAIAHAALSRTDLRAPIRLLRFQHRMVQLARLAPAIDGAQLELAFRDSREKIEARSVRGPTTPASRAAARQRDEPAGD